MLALVGFFFAINLFVIVAYSLSGFRVTAGAFQLGDITAIIEYAFMALFYLMMAQLVILTLPRAFECANRVNEVFNFSPTIQDKTEKEIWFPASCENVLEFQDVSFRFTDSEKYTLKNLNFSCKRGTTTAIIGGTGSGKSTIASLILRFNEVTNGSLNLKNVDIQKMPQHQLRDHIVYVQQRAWLFAGTIAENIAYGKPNATREEIVRAAEMARVDYFIRTMPQGYDTIVDNDAGNLSVGQRQLITIARVFLCDPPIIILDEATSSVDTRTEAEIGKSMKELMKGRTSFVIAHRLGAIRDADIILYMENGNIIEQGSHQELLSKGGAYASLYNSQFA